VDSAQSNPEFDESANDDAGVDDTLRPAEALDSDEVRNDDGDTVVDPPDDWSEADRTDEGRTLDDRLAEEMPDQPGAGGGVAPDDELDRIDTEDTGTSAGQVEGSPEDGDPIFPVVE
jgi:hypothetical protein